MRRRYWLAAAGLLIFAAAFARNWRAPEGWDRMRMEAIEARAAAAVKEITGIDVKGWPRTTVARMDPVHRRWQELHARAPIDRILTPLGVTFTFRVPGQNVEVGLSADGTPRLVRRNDRNPGRPPEADPDGIAERALKVLAREFAPQFRRDYSDTGERFRWKAVSPSDPQHFWLVTVRFEGGRFQSAALEPRFEDRRRSGIAREAHFFESEAYSIVQGLALFAGAMWALMAYMMGWARGVVDHRLALAAGLLFTLFEALEHAGGGAPFAWPMLAGSLGAGLMAALLTGTGRLAASGREWLLWQEFCLALGFRWRAKRVGLAVWNGLIWAGAVAAVPVAVAAILPAPSTLAVTKFMDAALSRWPLLTALAPLMEHEAYGLFVFLLPVLRRRVSPERFRWIFVPLAAVAIFLLLNPFATGVGAAVVSAAGLAALLVWIYGQYGLLSVLTAIKGAAVMTIAACFVRSGEWLLFPGLGLLGLVALAGAAAACVAAYGEDIVPAGEDADRDAAFVSEHERLKAEFSLAQRAQQLLLPSEAPSIPGFSIAALCAPARDVGGDLYDYFPLPGGRLGLCVADVSGKGIAAALYMTLTKGVLAAAAPEYEDVAELAVHLNRHLYAAGKRKVFVTAVIAALDAESRSVEYVRAGHNPVLHRSGRNGSARYLRATGMGLGMTNGAAFERLTRVERVDLEEGDILVLYSDGVTEAMNSRREQYGEERLLELVERSAASDAAALVEEIRRGVAAFTANEPAHDDVTVLVLKA
ncbi:MAG: PP2C family protein-serine/threonine phosphatase [Bryobacteraceae bacterium]|nr:PP2C family protein-serine/threonine phosphatase [Bryobacteraceae bacterium]